MAVQSSETRSSRRSTTRRETLLSAFLCVSAVGALACYAIVAGPHVYAADGDSYPGALTAVAEPVGFFVAALAAAISFGGLLRIVTSAQPGADGVIDPHAFRVYLLVERASVVWALSALVMVVIQAASDAGLPVTRILGAAEIGDAVLSSELARGWIVVVLAAVAVATCVRLSVRWVAQTLLLVPALIGVVAIAVSGDAAQGPDHDYSTSAAIVFAAVLTALAGVKLTATAAPPAEAIAGRMKSLEIACGGVALMYGSALFSTLVGSSAAVGTTYGRAGLAALGVLAVVWVGDVASLVSFRRRHRPVSRRITVSGRVAMIVVLALISSLATQTAPRLLNHSFTTSDVFLGYGLPKPPGVQTLLSVWRFDTLIGSGALVLALLYMLGVFRLRRRGDSWPAGSSIVWLSGCLILFFTSSSGVKAYGSAMFSVHMAEHMILNMLVPVLLVLGGPVTLALRACAPAGDGRPPGPREWLLWLLHSKVTAVLSHPVTAFVLFVASLYAVYFTPLFDTLVRYHWGHELMSVHFLLVGYLFFWGIIGIDPGPRKLPFLARLGLLFAVMPFHAFFGIAVMTMTAVIGGGFYRNVALPWLSSLAADQHLGGAIAWGASELPVIVVVVALVAQWARDDRRAATRSDRHADADYGDDELDAYNAMLRELSRNRR